MSYPIHLYNTLDTMRPQNPQFDSRFWYNIVMARFLLPVTTTVIPTIHIKIIFCYHFIHTLACLSCLTPKHKISKAGLELGMHFFFLSCWF